MDADSGRNDDFRSEPTRIVKSSDGGQHWFWLLSRPMPPHELQAVNKALTRKIGGDKGGHSPAKLFRLSGFHNFKYDPPFRVSLLEDTGEVHDADELRAFARQAGEHSRSNVVEIGDALAASHDLCSSRIIERYKHKLYSNTRARLHQRSICGPMGVVVGDEQVSRYLRRDIDENGQEVDQDFRVLSRMKANFAHRQDAIDLCWRDGVFVVNDPVNDRPSITDIDRKLIDEVARAFDAGTPWSAHHQAGHRHVVRRIAPKLNQSRGAARAMLSRMLSEGRVVEIQIDAHTRRNGLCTPEQAAKQLRNKEAK